MRFRYGLRCREQVSLPSHNPRINQDAPELPPRGLLDSLVVRLYGIVLAQFWSVWRGGSHGQCSSAVIGVFKYAQSIAAPKAIPITYATRSGQANVLPRTKAPRRLARTESIHGAW